MAHSCRREAKVSQEEGQSKTLPTVDQQTGEDKIKHQDLTHGSSIGCAVFISTSKSAWLIADPWIRRNHQDVLGVNRVMKSRLQSSSVELDWATGFEVDAEADNIIADMVLCKTQLHVRWKWAISDSSASSRGVPRPSAHASLVRSFSLEDHCQGDRQSMSTITALPQSPLSLIQPSLRPWQLLPSVARSSSSASFYHLRPRCCYHESNPNIFKQPIPQSQQP